MKFYNFNLKFKHLVLIVLLPLIGTLVSSPIIQYFQSEKKQVEYEVRKFPVLSTETRNGTDIMVDATEQKRKFGVSVILKNSGNVPIKNLNVEYQFSPIHDEVLFYNRAHQSKSVSEKDIRGLAFDPEKAEFEYLLLNEDDQLELHLITDKELNVTPRIRGEGVEVKKGLFMNIPYFRFFVFFIVIVLIFLVFFTFWQRGFESRQKEFLKEVEKLTLFYEQGKERGLIIERDGSYFWAEADAIPISSSNPNAET